MEYAFEKIENNMRRKMTEQMKEWSGKFGEEYTDRNLMPLEELDQLYINNFGISRTELNKEFLGDLEIGKILESAGNDIRVLVMSDHGFGPRQHGNGCLNQWLHEAGFLNFRKNPGGISISGFLKVIYQTLEKVLSRQLKERLFGLVPGLISKVHSRVFFSDIDWEHTIAYSDNIMPVIWINTIDAGPAGKVKNEDYEHVVFGLKSALLEKCLEASSGRHVVEWVKHREEIYNGDNLYKAPDVLIRWKESEKIDGLRYGAGGKPIIPVYPTREFAVISGDHRPYGIFMAAGEGIKRNTEVHDLNIVDVPATAIYLNGVPLPVTMEGSVRGQIFEDKFLSEMPLEISGQGIDSEDGEFQEFSKEEESALRHRLRGLGYLE